MLKRFFAAMLAAWVGVAGAQALNPVTGTITTQNLVAAGDCTPGSCVEIDVTGIASVTVQTKGTYTGALSAQVTTNRKDWVTECSSSCTSTFTRRTTGVATATITSGEEDIYQVQFANGAKRLRITGLAAVTGTANITIQPSNVGAGSSSSSAGGGDASAANQTTGNNSLGIMDDWDESDRAKVNIIVGQAGVTAGAGAVAANTPRFTLASDDPVITAINATDAVSTATLSNVAASATNVTCLASNASRKRAIILNDSASATLYVKPGATASTTSHTWQVAPGGTLTLDNFPVYTGILDCIWSAAVGSARVTEF
jgi:hypothetical protein